MNRYKLIIAPTPDRLELLVNAYLDKLLESYNAFAFIGAPQVMGHEEYCQAIEVYT